MWGMRKARQFHQAWDRLVSGGAAVPRQRNEPPPDPLVAMGEKISRSRYPPQPPSASFAERLLQQLLAARQAPNTARPMGMAPKLTTSVWSTLVAKRAYLVVAVMLLVALVGRWFLPTTGPAPQPPAGPAGGFFAGFSPLGIRPAHAQDTFSLVPEQADSMGVAAESAYRLTSKTPADPQLIRRNLNVSPASDYQLQTVSPTEWRITLRTPPPPNTIVKFSLAAESLDAGTPPDRSYVWAYQVKNRFKVLHSVPRQAGTHVPVDTGIEVTFSYSQVADFPSHFSIFPSVPGRFEQHGRTMVFVPNQDLAPATLYTIRVSGALSLAGSSATLGEDYAVTFETRGEDRWGSGRTYLAASRPQYEVSSAERPLFDLSTNLTAGAPVQVTVYGVGSWAEYLEMERQRAALPWWSFAYGNYRFKTSDLQPISQSTLPLQLERYTEYVQLPAALSPGFYLVEFSSSGQTAQALAQVTDLSAYLQVATDRTLVWVNNLRTQQPVAGASIALLPTPATATTNAEGIAVLATPPAVAEALQTVAANRATDAVDPRPVLRVTQGEQELVARMTWREYDYADGQPDAARLTADGFWKYLYTDRPQYQPTDTIQFWGVLKDRSGRSVEGAVTLALAKEGYWDYDYQPIRIGTQTIPLTERGTFSGEFALDHLKPDHYTLELAVGGTVVERRYLQIAAYVKPAYQLKLVPNRTVSFAGEEVRLQAQASFFDGSPVPGLRLRWETAERRGVGDVVTTDPDGRVALTYTKPYTGCSRAYSCWPDFTWLTLRPEESELADIEATVNLAWYGPKIYLTTTAEYPAAGVAEISLRARRVDVAALQAATSGGAEDRRGAAPSPGAKINGMVRKTSYSRREIGSSYDFISKRTVRQYQYDQHTAVVGTPRLEADADGRATYRLAVEPETSYTVDWTITDEDGRIDHHQTYLYYYDGSRVRRYANDEYQFYQLDLPDRRYSINDPVAVTMQRNNEPLAGSAASFLFLQLQDGLQEYAVIDQPTYRFLFEPRDVPNVNLVGVHFTGATYVVAPTTRYGNGVRLNPDDRRLTLTVQPDQPSYQPGASVNLTVTVRGPDGEPSAAEVNLNLVDEAYYAVANDVATPASSLYADLAAGTLFAGATHQPPATTFGGAEMGCFTAGTQILMADGTTRAIAAVRVGDRVRTLADPTTNVLTSGTVTAVSAHLVGEIWVINEELEVTPEHRVFANGRFVPVGELREGDQLQRADGTAVRIRSIRRTRTIQRVYNLHVDPQRTFFANGYYVHNEKGGGSDSVAVRERFKDTALFQAVVVGSSGQARTSFTLPDNITSWRVTAQGISSDLGVGVGVGKIPVSLPVFLDVAVGEEYLVDDHPVAKLRAYGTALSAGVPVRFSLEAPDLGVAQTTAAFGTAYQPTSLPLPKLRLGRHALTYRMTSERGRDAVKLPLSVVASRLLRLQATSIAVAPNAAIAAAPGQDVTVVLTDVGHHQLYQPLEHLAWSWGDRLDQIVAREKARGILATAFGEERSPGELEALAPQYQAQDGGLTLLPYSSTDLELSAGVAAVGGEAFDQLALQQYFRRTLDSKASTPEEVTLALYGLANLGEPVLPWINHWRTRPDLSVKEQLYLALGAAQLGAKELARSIAADVLGGYGQSNGQFTIVRSSDDPNDVLSATALTAVLASALDLPERDRFWAYAVGTVSPDLLVSLEQLAYIQRTQPRISYTPARVTYEVDGQRRTAEISPSHPARIGLESQQVPQFRFVAVAGAVAGSTRVLRPAQLEDLSTSPALSLRREYYVNGRPTTSWSETDLVEVRLYPTFGAVTADEFQLTDLLPSGLVPVVRYASWGQEYDCRYWHPYRTEGQRVKYRISSTWRQSGYCPNDYLKYYARVKTTGTYRAEPALLQSFRNPELVTSSVEQAVTIR